MKRIAWFLITFTTIAVLAACNNTNTTNNSKKETGPLQATLTIPKTAKIGNKIELKVNVSQGGQAVTNAKDVAFEVENSATDSDKIVTAKLRDGAYVASYDIKDSGKYKITAHISSKSGEHAMSNAEITVSQKASQDNYNSTTGSVTEKHDHHHDVAITYNHKHTVVKDKAVNLSVTLKYDGKTLSGADVHYQVLPQFKNGQPTWITLKETSKGTYTGKHTFTQSGNYQLKLHVENDKGLHTHEEKDLIVK